MDNQKSPYIYACKIRHFEVEVLIVRIKSYDGRAILKTGYTYKKLTIKYTLRYEKSRPDPISEQ